MITVSKLDGRHTGYKYFKYLVKTTFPSEFFKLREWCWTTWGASKEIDDWLDDELRESKIDVEIISKNAHWAWQNNEYGTRIYLKDDDDVVLFRLRWQ